MGTPTVHYTSGSPGPTTVLRLAAAPTGAWVVSSDTFPSSPQPPSQVGHDGIGSQTLFPKVHNLFQWLFSMGIELFKTAA